MLNFQFNFNFVQCQEPWVGTVITRGIHFKTDGPNFFRYNRWKFPILSNKGWHLSTFGDLHTILYKLKNFSHCDDEQVKDRDEEYVNNFIIRNKCTAGSGLRRSTVEDLKHVPFLFLNKLKK